MQNMGQTVDHIAYGFQARTTYRPLIAVHPARLVMYVVKDEIATDVEYGVDAGS